ncbi:metal ABC transporter permease [Fontivita pretiosa]|uniref:metal ABC transporter permease n=1 Tax=Fontivita pretiosa TaxID=2989684 RepID=UPI003D186B4D
MAPFSPSELGVYWPIVVEGVLVSCALGLIGCFLVVRGMSLLGDALSHSVLPGIVLGFLISVHTSGQGSLRSPWIFAGATAVGILAALLVETVEKQSRVKEDASLGIIFTTMFALGVVMINLFAGQADLDPGCVLYGNIEYFTVYGFDGIRPMAFILGGIILGLLIFYRHLLVSVFDPALAISMGIPAVLIHYMLMAALSLTVVASFEAVGAILAVALLIMPGATARLWSDRMPSMLILAAVHGVLSTILGYWLSHPAIFDTSAAGAISLAGFVLFLGSWLLAPRYGVLMQAIARRRLRRTIAAENLVKMLDELIRSGRPEPIGLSELAAAMRLAPRQFASALALARGQGLVDRADGTIRLTDAGRARAERLIRAHQLWEQYLQQQVGIAPDHVHDAAEWIEHHLSDQAVQEIDQTLAKT